jgi:hypothetical protein
MRLRIVTTLVIITILLTGCSLLGAGNERERQNEEVTQSIELGDIVTAEGVGNDNEPINETDSFDSSQDYIYVVAEADFIEEGTTLFARWYRDNDPFEDSEEITADRDYRDTYLEFHLENLDDRLEEGDYSVEILANGNRVGEAEFEVN